jgi:hypothetical protein
MDETAEATTAMIEALKRWGEAPSLKRGMLHLAERRGRLEATCALLLAHATPEEFAKVMNRVRPGQRIRHEMTAETAAKVQVTLTPAELADMVETALEWTPHEVDAYGCFDALWQIEVGGHKPEPGEENNDRTVKKAQQARRWLGQRKRHGRPAAPEATAASIVRDKLEKAGSRGLDVRALWDSLSRKQKLGLPGYDAIRAVLAGLAAAGVVEHKGKGEFGRYAIRKHR